jgi:hypothetical protein
MSHPVTIEIVHDRDQNLEYFIQDEAYFEAQEAYDAECTRVSAELDDWLYVYEGFLEELSGTGTYSSEEKASIAQGETIDLIGMPPEISGDFDDFYWQFYCQLEEDLGDGGDQYIDETAEAAGVTITPGIVPPSSLPNVPLPEGWSVYVATGAGMDGLQAASDISPTQIAYNLLTKSQTFRDLVQYIQLYRGAIPLLIVQDPNNLFSPGEHSSQKNVRYLSNGQIVESVVDYDTDTGVDISSLIGIPGAIASPAIQLAHELVHALMALEGMAESEFDPVRLERDIATELRAEGYNEYGRNPGNNPSSPYVPDTVTNPINSPSTVSYAALYSAAEAAAAGHSGRIYVTIYLPEDVMVL